MSIGVALSLGVMEAQTKAKRTLARREKVEKRDGHMSKAQRTRRFQEVIGRCGMGTPGSKECMKAALGQEDVEEEKGDLIMF